MTLTHGAIDFLPQRKASSVYHVRKQTKMGNYYWIIINRAKKISNIAISAPLTKVAMSSIIPFTAFRGFFSSPSPRHHCSESGNSIPRSAYTYAQLGSVATLMPRLQSRLKPAHKNSPWSLCRSVNVWPYYYIE